EVEVECGGPADQVQPFLDALLLLGIAEAVFPPAAQAGQQAETQIPAQPVRPHLHAEMDPVDPAAPDAESDYRTRQFWRQQRGDLLDAWLDEIRHRVGLAGLYACFALDGGEALGLDLQLRHA